MPLLVALLIVLAQPSPTTVYVGPHVRDGFVDVDQGVLDSIADIKTELGKSRQVRLTDTPTGARVVLYVIGRHSPGSGDAIGIPVGTMTVTSVSKRRAIQSLLTVGTYERRFVSEDDHTDTWKAAAKRTARDVLAWIDANQARLQ